jgi:hypothetical protein
MVGDSLGRAYNRTQFLEQRRDMMGKWADLSRPAARRRPGAAAEGEDSMIDATEVYVVQSRPKGAGEWESLRQYDEDGPALDLADYLREDGDTEARVVRRWCGAQPERRSYPFDATPNGA